MAKKFPLTTPTKNEMKITPGKPLEDAKRGVEIKSVWRDDPDGIISENGRSNK